MKLKIFWKKDCPNCPGAKKYGNILKDKLEVQYCNIDTVDGLSEACMFNVMSTPSIILIDKDNNEIQAWRGEIPKIENIKGKISEYCEKD
jgi:thioredoxin-related protein